ncbi:MAG: hypothetical protein H6625_01275 [Bdellovibrionaceae bacterium]|nr:hypothetical protein [Pseudobdellovibrionaceae bacterium]
MNQDLAIEKFENYVGNLYEIEYGDFKRKLSLYILRLEQGCDNTSPKVARVIKKMREKVIYSPDGNIENTRAEVLDLVKELA